MLKPVDKFDLLCATVAVKTRERRRRTAVILQSEDHGPSRQLYSQPASSLPFIFLWSVGRLGVLFHVD